MIIWFEVKKDREIIINVYNAEIKAVRYTQIIDDDKDTENSMHCYRNKVNKRKKFKAYSN